MKKIDVYYNLPNNKNKQTIIDMIASRRMHYYEFGLLFSSCFFAISCLLLLIWVILHLSNTFLISILFILESSLFSFIGAIRSKRELQSFRDGDYFWTDAVVIDVKKRNFWSTFVTVQCGEIVETFSQIGNKFVKDDKIIIAIANPEKISWALPRLLKCK